MVEITVERIEEGDPQDPDVTLAVYNGNAYVGYLTNARTEYGLYFIAALTISEQIAVLQGLQTHLARVPLEPTDGLTMLQFRLAKLDQGLTQKRWEDVLHTARTRKATLDDLYDKRLYYLSDGGYSRIGFSDDEDMHLFFADGAEDKVAREWEGCKDLRNAVEVELRRLAKQAGWLK